MGSNNNRKQQERRKQKIFLLIVSQVLLLIILVSLGLFLIFYLPQKADSQDKKPSNSADKESEDTKGSDNKEETKVIKEEKALELKELAEKAIGESNALALQYNYGPALSKLEEFEGLSLLKDYETLYGSFDNKEIDEAKTSLLDTISKLDHLGALETVEEVNHVFFHSLIVDTDKAFDGDSDANGYNYYMTTVDEFKAMMGQMYEEGYVLVSIHDLIKPVEQEDGTIIMQEQELLLPPDKKPFVLSQDDVNYYDYMKGDGFATKIVIHENGRPSAEMILKDGSKSVGDYDMVPVLETFIEEHPDFSYQGARGILALTGYEGALGYRTNDKKSTTYEEDKAAVREVAKVLKEWGWEFASHSWGHRDMEKYKYSSFTWDTERWLEEVGSLIGPTDIYIFPYGVDIEGPGSYKSEKFHYLHDKGFLYYCGVFKSPWMQHTKDYLRMTRRPLDGQAMLQYPERLKDLFNLESIIDPARPALK